MSRKTKTVNYRKVELTSNDVLPEDTTLEKLIFQALQSEKVPRPAKIDYGIEGQGSHLLLHSKADNKPYYKAGCLCGHISLYDDESKVPLVDSEYNKEKGEVFSEQVPPMDSNNKLRKLQHQVHYFAVKENHIAIMASSAKGIDMLRDFFTILIQDISEVLPTISIKFVNVPTKNALEAIAGKPIKSVCFSSSAYTHKVQSVSETETMQTDKRTSEYIRKTYEEENIVKRIIDAIGSTPILDIYKDTDDITDLCVSVEFKCKQRKSESSQRIVKDLARHLGGIEGISPIIHLSGKSYISNEELTIKDTISVEGEGKNLNAHNAMETLANWLKNEIENGLV